ncbi:MAG: flagellar basal body-associated protein FliL [Comamonas sp.]
MADSKTPRPPSKLLFRLLGLLVLLALFALSGAGGAWFYAKREHPVAIAETAGDRSPAANPDASVPPPIFLALDPFTVMLTDGMSERVVHTAITLRLKDQESVNRIERYKPEVRSRVLLVLSAQSPETIALPEARQKLGQDIASALSKPFQPLVAEQQVEDILFTDFVVQ